MTVVQCSFSLSTGGKGLVEVTAHVESELERSGLRAGTATLFCQHTSCSLVIMENADPSARADLEAFFERLVPQDDPHFLHTFEGPDDMPSHIKMALTRTSEVIPFSAGKLLLGTWQGVFLWEHRDQAHRRTLQLTLQGE